MRKDGPKLVHKSPEKGCGFTVRINSGLTEKEIWKMVLFEKKTVVSSEGEDVQIISYHDNRECDCYFITCMSSPPSLETCKKEGIRDGAVVLWDGRKLELTTKNEVEQC